jgi:hypothetical protein
VVLLAVVLRAAAVVVLAQLVAHQLPPQVAQVARAPLIPSPDQVLRERAVRVAAV